MDDNENKFSFTYTAPKSHDADEVATIRSRYVERDDHFDDIAKIKKLDKRARRLPIAVCTTLCLLGVGIFALGLSMILKWDLIAGGISIAFLGGLFVLFAFPLFSVLLRYSMDKYSSEIVALSDRVLGDDPERPTKE